MQIDKQDTELNKIIVNEEESKKVLIIGSGVAGLTAATYVARGFRTDSSLRQSTWWPVDVNHRC